MDRDFDMEKVIDKMRSIREKRKLEMLNAELEKADSNPDTEKRTSNDKVLNVKYLGVVEIDGKEKGIYLVLEQKENEDGTLAEIERYYTEDEKCIGGNNNSDQYEYLILNAKYANEKELAKKLQALDKEGILDLNNLEQERLEEIARALGVDVEEIQSINEIDVNIKEKGQKSTNKDSKENEDERVEISEEGVKGLDIKEETEANTYLKGETLDKKLGLAEKGITGVKKIARVSTSNLKNVTGEKTTNNEDSFVAIKSDNTAVVLGEDILKKDTRRGNNPRGESLTINNDGSVSREAITSSYLIVNGNGQEYLQCGYDESSGKEIKYTLRSNTTGEDVATELETQRTYDDDSYVRGFLNDRNEGIYEPDKIMERDKEHGECDEKDVTVIDNDKDNDSHEHFVVNEEYIRVKAKDIIDGNEDIKEVFTEREVEDLLKRRIEEQKEQKTVEEIIENAKQELEQETQHFRSRGF